MSIQAGKLEQIKQLINGGFRQDAAVLCRDQLRLDPENGEAWSLLAQVTSGPAREMCLKKAVEFGQSAVAPSADLIDLDETIPFVPPPQPTTIEPQRLATADSASSQIDHQPSNDEPKQRYGFRYWATVGTSGVLLGCLIIFLLNIFPALSTQSSIISANSDSETESEAELIAAVFEVSSPTPAISAEQIQEVFDNQTEVAPLPATNTPAAAQGVGIAKIIGEDGEPRSPWTPTPTPTPTATPTPTIEPTKLLDDSYTSFNLPPVAADERWVDVNLTLQTLTAYEGKTPVFQTIISSGRPPYYTVTGQFRVYYRLPEQTMDGRRLGFSYVTPGVPHVQYFYGDFAIHGAYWHDDFGTPVSHGCVNVTPADAEWLYNWMSYGTLVNVHY